MTKVVSVSGLYDALVDDEDYERINEFPWSLNNSGYASARGGRLMHRMVLWDVPEVHHINHDKLDNRRSNLIATDRAANMLLVTEPNKNNRSGFRGVRARNGRFVAYHKYQGTQIWVGTYDTAEEANEAYENAKQGLI